MVAQIAFKQHCRSGIRLPHIGRTHARGVRYSPRAAVYWRIRWVCPRRGSKMTRVRRNDVRHTRLSLRTMLGGVFICGMNG